MQYMLLICTDATAPADSGPDDVEQWVEEMDARGIRLSGERLRPPSDATVVKVRDGEVIVIDGPFAETKDWIAGYDIIECDDLDAAIEVASKHAMARGGQIEIRPMWPFE
jgi:hypothetical protein